MFGNRIGFGVSVVILIAAVGFLWLIQSIGTAMSPVTAVGANAANYSMKLPINPRDLASWMTEDGDSTPVYKELDAFLDKEHNAIYFFTKEPALKSTHLGKVEQAVALLAKAGKLKGGGVFKDSPADLITYDSDRPRLKRIEAMKDALVRLGALYTNAKQIDKARDLYQGMFSMGVKMYEERMIFDEWFWGRELMAVSRYLGEFEAEKSPAAAEKFKSFDAQFLPFYKANIEPVQSAIQVLDPNSGDVAALALRGGDVMWRVEATFALGRVKFSGHTAPDQKGALRIVTMLANESDVRIKMAAIAARDLTVEDFRKLR